MVALFHDQRFPNDLALLCTPTPDDELAYWGGFCFPQPYTLLHYGAQPPPCLMSFDRGRGRVIGLGSFSKLLAPGLRVGWLHAHPRLVEAFARHGTLRSGGALNPWLTAAVTTLIEQGRLAENIDHLRATFARRMTALVAALRAALPGITLSVPGGGYFLWVPLPGLPPAGADVTVLDGRRCSPSGGCAGSARLSVSLYDAPTLEEGVRRLAAQVR